MLSFNKIVNLTTRYNLGSGLITKTPWIAFEKCTFDHNHMSGFKFDPRFFEEELFEYRSAMLKTLNMLQSPSANGVTYLSIHTTGLEVLTMPVGHYPEQVITPVYLFYISVIKAILSGHVLDRIKMFRSQYPTAASSDSY